eukprot:scaffold28117_cov64-Phaeocystis_antarctica.AAC.11
MSEQPQQPHAHARARHHHDQRQRARAEVGRAVAGAHQQHEHQQHATADGVRQRRGGEVQGGRLVRQHARRRPAEPHDGSGRHAREQQQRGEERERDQEAHEAPHVPTPDVVAHELAEVVEAAHVPVRVAREHVAFARVVQLGQLLAGLAGVVLFGDVAGAGLAQQRRGRALRHARVQAHGEQEEERRDTVHAERREGDVQAEPGLHSRRHQPEEEARDHEEEDPRAYADVLDGTEAEAAVVLVPQHARGREEALRRRRRHGVAGSDRGHAGVHAAAWARAAKDARSSSSEDWRLGCRYRAQVSGPGVDPATTS